MLAVEGGLHIDASAFAGIATPAADAPAANPKKARRLII
jgi:hypothetical protein